MKDPRDQDEIYSNPVRAGKRTYFFDVRATKSEDYYLTITESKRTFDDSGVPQYKKHKIFLYKEDFVKFRDALTDVIDFIVKEKGEEIISNKEVFEQKTVSEESPKKDDFTDISFEDI
tara:strand:+ start:3554 stop:3907 length:354 start_codon:yes stop_codon:yes gene_type:complete